jgi:hypothetical protein
MGHKSRRRRRAQAVACNREPMAVSAPPPAPATIGGNWITRFAVVFLIIFVLLWLCAPQEQHHK